MKTFQIALYPGDGIGVEVVEQAVRVLEKTQQTVGGFQLRMTSFPWGVEYCKQHGKIVPDDFLEVLKPFDAIFLGALGDPRQMPDHITLDPLIRLRQGFDQYACLRPCRLPRGVPSLLARSCPIDLVVVRENSEGEYALCGGRHKQDQSEEIAIQTAIHTRRGVERIMRFGFQLARKRQNRLTMITKSNALRYGMVLWDHVLEQLRSEFPEVQADRQHADAAAMDMVRRPEKFDVIVASNLFGDILSDLGGIISGGLGMAPSANINPDRTFPSMFEPVHGSAPDIVGRGIANPIAAILSAAMMLDWLELSQAAAVIRKAIDAALEAGAATPDLGGTLTTSQMTDRIIGCLNALTR